MATKNTIRSRVEEDLAVWDAIEARQIRRYGPSIRNDPGFIAAKRDMYQHIIGKYSRQQQNLHEKADLRVVRSQRRAMLRRMFPNPFLRLGRNVFVFALNLVWLIVRMAWAAITAPIRLLITPPRGKQATIPDDVGQTPDAGRTRQDNPDQAQQQTQDKNKNRQKPKSTQQKNRQQKKETSQQQQPSKGNGQLPQRMRPSRTRMVAPTNPKGLKR